MPKWPRCAITLALSAGLTACLGVQPGEIAWPGSRIWESPPAEASLTDARSSADLPGADLTHEIELAQGRATLPERPVLAKAPLEPQATDSAADDPLVPASPGLGDGPAAGPAVLRVVPGAELVPPGSASTIQEKHEYELYFRCPAAAIWTRAPCGCCIS
jgi:hypothetical protein